MQSLKQIAAIATLLLSAVVSMQTQAISTFARQTNLPCASCHFQTYPALNSFGRLFKANGYALSVAPAGSDTGELSLIDSLNAGIVTKIRYQKSNGPKVSGTNNTNDGEFQFPDELLLDVAARVSNNIGILLEMDLNDASPLLSGVKLPMIYNVKGMTVGAIPFNTSSQGASYGFEMLNTGSVRFSRVAEDRKGISAQQYIGTATKAQGIAAVASNSQFFANVTKWSPRAIGDNTGSLTSNYFRLAATPRVGSWDMGGGIQVWSGSSTDPGSLTKVDTKAWAIDGQMQGEIAAKPVGIYLSYAVADGTPASSLKRNLFNGNPKDKKAAAIIGQLGILPGKATALLSYRHGENGKSANSSDNAWMLGGTYMLRQNVELQLNHTMYSGDAYDGRPVKGDRMTTVMFYASF